MARSAIFICAAMMLAFGLRSARADHLTTVKGLAYEGRVVYEDDKVVKFKIGAAVITFKRSEIKELRITHQRIRDLPPLRTVGGPKTPKPVKPGVKPPPQPALIGALKTRKLSPGTLKSLYNKLAEGPGRAGALMKCEALVNLYLAENDAARRAEIVRQVDALGLPPEATEAVLARGRHYEDEPTEDVRTELVIRETGGKGDVLLRVPRNYDPRRAYPLLVTLHAGGDRAESALAIWNGEPDRRGYIVVAPQAAAPGKLLGRTRAGLSNIVSAIDLVMDRYHIDPDRVYCEGMSMGGRASWDMALSLSDRVAAVASRSGPVPMTRGVRAAASPLAPSPMLPNTGRVGVFIVHGDADELVDVALVRQTVDVLKKRGTDHAYHEVPAGGHEAFGKYNGRILDFFSKRTRDPSPKSLTFVTNDADAVRHYWIEIAGFMPGPLIDASLKAPDGKLIEKKSLLVRPASVKARLAGPNEIRIETAGVKALKVHLNRKWIDFNQPVKIYWNGRLRHNAVVIPSTTALLENARIRHRRDLLYPAAVTVTP